MKIWLSKVSAGDPLERDEQREDRASAISDYLVSQGHDTTLFCSAFDHHAKRRIYQKTTIKWRQENERIVYVHAKTIYEKNKSLKRMVHNRQLANELRKIINEVSMFERPDVIFSAYPTPEWCKVFEEYGNLKGVPVVIDAIDLWPDAFLRIFPKPLRPLFSIALFPLKRQAEKIFKDAVAISAMAEPVMEWALNYARRKKKSIDRVIFIAAKKPIIEERTLEKQQHEWRKYGVSQDTWNICVFSGLNSVLDIDTVIEAVKEVHERYPHIRYVQGGVGIRKDEIETKVKDMDYIVFPGWLDNNQMVSLMSICKVGMVPYINDIDMRHAFGNKVGQYLSMGLPIIESPDGGLKDYVTKNQCGIFYHDKHSGELTRVLVDLIEHQGKIEELSRNANCAYERDFEHEKVMRIVEQMLIDVVKENERSIIEEN